MTKNVPDRTWTITPVNDNLSSGDPTAPLPDQVTGVQAGLTGGTFIELSWSAAANAVGYAILVDGVTNLVVTGLSGRASGLAQVMQYSITIRGINIEGQGGPPSAALLHSTGPTPDWVGTPFPLFEQSAIRSYTLAGFIQPEDTTSVTYASTGTALPSGITLAATTGVLTNDGTAALSDVSTYSFSFDDTVNVISISNVRIRVLAGSVPTVPTAPLSASITSTGFTLSWTASTDGGGDLSGYRIWKNGVLYVDTGNTGVSFAVTGQQAGVTNLWRISAYDAAGNESGRSASLSVAQAAATATWSVNTPAYTPIIPGVAGFGADQSGGSGRRLGGSNDAAIIYVNTLSTANSGTFNSTTRIGTGTIRYAAGFAGDRHVIFLVAGTIDFTTGGSRAVLVSQGRMTVHGQTAPGPLLFRGGTWKLQAASECVFWHVGFAQDLFSLSNDAETQGDNVQAYNAPVTSKVLWANCSFQFSSDENFDHFGNVPNTTIWQCLFTEPLTSAGHPKGNHAYNALFRIDNDPLSIQRSVFAHAVARNPLTDARRFTFANNIIYNWTNRGVNLGNYGGANSDNNIESNLFLTGPQTSNLQPITISPAFDENTGRVYVANNRATGVSDATQAGLIDNDAGVTLEGSRISSAFPAGYTVHPIAAGDDGKAQFAQLVIAHVGPKPLSRLAMHQRTLTHIENRISGVGSQGGHCPTPAGCGGFPSLSLVGPIDPAAPGAHWNGVACPQTLSTRNVVQASGYTLIEEWAHGVASLFMPAGWST